MDIWKDFSESQCAASDLAETNSRSRSNAIGQAIGFAIGFAQTNLVAQIVDFTEAEREPGRIAIVIRPAIAISKICPTEWTANGPA